jgi:microcystin degradation protein MlrC
MCSKGSRELRVFVGGIIQESNTFCPYRTGLDLFKRGYLLRGEEIPQSLGETNTEIGGFYSSLQKREGVEILPGLAAWAVASGRLANRALRYLTDGLVHDLKRALPVEGVLLALHGSLVSEGLEDCEGYILEKVRETVGHMIPVVSTLDYHACLTKKMVDAADILVGFRTYPHVDFKETGERAAALLLDLIFHQGSLQSIYRKIPLILPVENTETSRGPIKSVIDTLERFDREPNVVTSSLFCPQPWLDVYDIGVSALLYIRSRASRASYSDRVAELLDSIWQRRNEFILSLPDVEEFMDTLESYARPILCIDSGDIISGGGIGDSTVLLRSLLRRNCLFRVVLPVVDPDTLKRALKMGEGREGFFDIGGRRDFEYNRRVRIQAEVVSIRDDPFEIQGASFQGLKINPGRRARLRTADNLNIIVMEYSSLVHDPQALISMGLDPSEQDIIVQKSHKLFRAAYDGIGGSIVQIDTPGFTDVNLKRLPFRKVQRPLYPLDEM